MKHVIIFLNPVRDGSDPREHVEAAGLFHNAIRNSSPSPVSCRHLAAGALLLDLAQDMAFFARLVALLEDRCLPYRVLMLDGSPTWYFRQS